MRLSILLTCVVLAGAQAWATGPTDSPLSPFAKFIGGRWHLEDSYMELEWGIGERSVVARSFHIVDGEPKLLSEGLWFWHPGEKKIKGVFTAIEMPVVLFLYDTRFEGDTMIGDLTSYDPDGTESRYVETWELVDESSFAWRLFSDSADGMQEQMGATYTRR